MPDSLKLCCIAVAIAAHGLPAPLALAWFALLVQLGASSLMLAGRFVWQACAAHRRQTGAADRG